MTAYFHEYVQPSLFILYDLSGTWWVKPEIKYVPSNAHLRLGARLSQPKRKAR